MRDKANIWRPLEIHGRVIVLFEATDYLYFWCQISTTLDDKSSTGWGWRIVQKDTAAACVLASPRPLLGPCSPVNSPHYPATYTKRNPHLWTYVAVFKWKWYEHHYMKHQLLQSLPRITGDNGHPVIHTYTTERGKLENPKSDRHQT